MLFIMIVVQVLMVLPSIPRLMELQMFVRENWYIQLACSVRIASIPVRISLVHSEMYFDHSSLWGS